MSLCSCRALPAAYCWGQCAASVSRPEPALDCLARLPGQAVSGSCVCAAALPVLATSVLLCFGWPCMVVRRHVRPHSRHAFGGCAGAPPANLPLLPPPPLPLSRWDVSQLPQQPVPPPWPGEQPQHQPLLSPPPQQLQPRLVATYDGHVDWVNDIALLRGLLVSASSDCTLRVWTPGAAAAATAADGSSGGGAGGRSGGSTPALHAAQACLPGHRDSITCLAAAEGAGLLASAGLRGDVLLWDVARLQQVGGSWMAGGTHLPLPAWLATPAALLVLSGVARLQAEPGCHWRCPGGRRCHCRCRPAAVSPAAGPVAFVSAEPGLLPAGCGWAGLGWLGCRGQPPPRASPQGQWEARLLPVSIWGSPLGLTYSNPKP